MDLGLCRIKDFDDVFEATRDSIDYEDAVNSLLYVLFDIRVGNIKSVDNKYLYISRNNDARRKAQLLQKEDLGHILVKFCMASFGLRCEWFNITDDDVFEFMKNVSSTKYSAYDMIEYIAYISMSDVNNAYDLLFSNVDNLRDVVKYMMDERYLTMLKDEIDSFTGLINNDTIDSDLRYKFYDAYYKLDDEFASIKRNSTEYIR